MTSVRQRLLRPLVAGLALLMAIGGAALYSAVRSLVLANFDATLETKARVLTALPATGRVGINLKFTEQNLPEFRPGPRAEYFQVRMKEGTILAKSASLGAADLILHPGPAGQSVFQDLVLPDGRPGRAVAITYDFRESESSAKPAGAEGRWEVVVILAREVQRLNQLLGRLLAGMIGGGVILLALMVWLILRATARGLEPVAAVARQVSAMDARSLAVRIPTAAVPPEIAPILEQFNPLMDRLQAAFERERRFTANAAHELATPLAELRALADNALRWRNDLEATGRFAADAHEIALQMQRLVEALLGLARCESGRQPVVAERIALSEMLGEIRAGLAPRLAARQLAMTWDTPDGLVLESDRAMCHSIFSNLLDNAVEHTPVGGQIISRLESAPTGFVFTLANTNPGLTPADLPHLFEPLWRKDTARTDRLHSGLGLALAKALAERLGMQIKAGLAENGMFQVVWCLPHHPLGGG